MAESGIYTGGNLPEHEKHTEKTQMMKTAKTSLAALAITLTALSARADTISGKVVDSAGKPMEGVMISAFYAELADPRN